MKEKSTTFPFPQFIALTAFLIAFKYRFLSAAGFDLHYDEAQYWEWSQQLDCYSKGPLVAWLIALSEAMFGHGEWQTRGCSAGWRIACCWR